MDKKPQMMICPKCNGKGIYPSKITPDAVNICEKCNGDGVIPYVEPSPKDKVCTAPRTQCDGVVRDICYAFNNVPDCKYLQAPQPEPMPQENYTCFTDKGLKAHDQQVRKAFALKLKSKCDNPKCGINKFLRECGE